MAHWHREIELILIDSGSLSLGVNQERRTLLPGDLAVLGSQDIHYYENIELSCAYSILIFSPELVDCPSLWPLNSDLTEAVLGAGILRDAVIAPLIKETIGELRKREMFYKPLVKGNLQRICALLERELGKPKKTVISGKDPIQQRMRQTLEFIHQQYRNPLRLEDAASRAAMSPSHFSKVFSGFMGENFNTYVNNVRLEKILPRLEANGESILEIAMDSGFESLRTFNRVFKNRFAQSPRSWRQGRTS
jgi:AraC-like DNA-binding protein